MSDYEMLKAILEEIKELKHDVNARFDKLEAEVKQNSADIKNLESKVENLEGKVENLEGKVENLEAEVKQNSADIKNLESKIEKLEIEVRHNSIVLEEEVNKMVDLLGEGYQMTNQKMREMDIDNLKSYVYEISMLCRCNREEISHLKKELSLRKKIG